MPSAARDAPARSAVHRLRSGAAARKRRGSSGTMVYAARQVKGESGQWHGVKERPCYFRALRYSTAAALQQQCAVKRGKAAFFSSRFESGKWYFSKWVAHSKAFVGSAAPAKWQRGSCWHCKNGASSAHQLIVLPRTRREGSRGLLTEPPTG